MFRAGMWGARGSNQFGNQPKSPYNSRIERFSKFTYLTIEHTMQSTHSVLVADDEAATRMIVASQLTEAGFTVVEAEDGEQAIQHLKKQKFEVALLDIKMPNVDGIEVLKYIRQHVPETKTIILTGFADLELAMEAMELGAIDFFNKPFSIDEVIASVKQAVSW